MFTDVAPTRFADCVRTCASALAVGLLVGCSTIAPTPAPAEEPLPQIMQDAGKAAAEGNKERARELYRTAAKTHPTSKEPWLKLAEDYFNAGNYGQAILSAQEVLQRDPADAMGSGVLAVSGLRVSASALATLRQQKGSLTDGTRTEAERLAQALRDVLGEPVLVPPPQSAAPLPPVVTTTNRQRPARPKIVPIGAAAAASAPPAPTAPKPAAPENPFNVLKK